MFQRAIKNKHKLNVLQFHQGHYYFLVFLVLIAVLFVLFVLIDLNWFQKCFFMPKCYYRWNKIYMKNVKLDCT